MWNIVGGSAVGKLHSERGRGCEDSFAWYVGQGVVCVAIADGAGSRRRSASGSAAAVGAALGFARSQEDGRPTELIGYFASARHAIEELAEAEGLPPSEFATTMAVVVIADDVVRIGQVGDSVVVARRGGGRIEAIDPGSRGDYINETVFVTSVDWEERLRYTSLAAEDVTGLALSTDGLQFKILEDVQTGTAYQPFFEDVFNYATAAGATSRALIEFIDNLDDQSGDDKTLVVVTPDSRGDARVGGL